MFKMLLKILSLLLLWHNVSIASDPYHGCVRGFETGAGDVEAVLVSPINIRCAQVCENSCTSLLSRTNESNFELNSSSIQDCIQKCRLGEEFKGSYFEVSSGALVTKGPIDLGVKCYDGLHPSSNISKTSLRLNAGQKFRVKVMDVENTSKVALCGKKSINMIPIVSSLDKDVWSSTHIPPVIAKNSSLCTYNMTPDYWNTLSVSKILETNVGNNICAWHARNNLFTDTGIFVQDGDELVISWSSTSIHDISSVPIAYLGDISRKNIYNISQDPNSSSSTRSSMSNLLEKQTYIQILNPGSDITKANASFSSIEGYKADTDDNVDVRWKGLKGLAMNTSRTYYEITSAPKCDTKEKRDANPAECLKINDPGLVYYSFSGIIENFSKTPSKLAFRHWDTSYNKYDDNVGGASVYINWSGCMFYDGKMLQYLIASDASEISEDLWKDVPSDAIEKGLSILAEKDGNIYFRIKGLEPPTNIPEEEKIRYTDPAYRYGQYYIDVISLDDNGLIKGGGPIKQLIDSVRATVQGDSKTGKIGVVELLFTALVKDSQLIAAVRAMMVLFVAFTGLGYILGTIQWSQLDLIKRLLKITALTIMISPSSWEFFSVYLFKGFMDGGLELIGKVVAGSMSTVLSLKDLEANPTLVFSAFDGLISVFTGIPFWKRIAALLMQFSLSFVIGIIAIMIMVLYMVTIAKVIMMFLMSIIILALLFFAAPFFISCSLFSLTQNFFNNWWKFMLSFTLQPVALFSAISIFNLLILMVFQSTFSFTVCPYCLFSLSIFKECIVGYEVLASLHYPSYAPSTFLLPIGLIENTLILLILTHAMYKFCELIVSITNMIVSGQMINVSSLQDYGNAMLDSGKWALGIDDASRMRRSRGGR